MFFMIKNTLLLTVGITGVILYIPKPNFWVFSIGFFDKTPAHLVFVNLYLSKEKCFINCGFVIRLFGRYFFNQFRRGLF